MKFYPGSVYPDEFYPFTGLSVYPVYPFYPFYPDEVYPEEGRSFIRVVVLQFPGISFQSVILICYILLTSLAQRLGSRG